MADQPAIQDPNRFPALIAHSGTADTADTQRVVAGADGGIYITGLHGVALTTGVAVGTASGGTALPPTTLANRKSMIFYNSGTAKVWFGGTEVGTVDTAGMPLGTTEWSPAFDFGTAVMYARAGIAGGTVTVLEVS